MTARAPSPAVTCVLIFLDGARFIDEAIRSVVAQGDDVDWELVLVDDGSTDQSTAIARRWASADVRIRYLEHAGHVNLGMSASRNAGVAAATRSSTSGSSTVTTSGCLAPCRTGCATSPSTPTPTS